MCVVVLDTCKYFKKSYTNDRNKSYNNTQVVGDKNERFWNKTPFISLETYLIGLNLK